MANFYVKPKSAVGGGTGLAEWTTGTAYAIGDRVVCRSSYNANRRCYVYECTTGGTSHGSTEPAWPTSGTVNDNGVIWTKRDPTTWANATCYLYYLFTASISFGFPGSIVWVSNTHDEIWTGDLLVGEFYTNLPTYASPIKVASTSDTTNEPPQSVAAGAKLRTSGHINFYSEASYWYGVEFHAGYNASSGTPCIFTSADNDGNAGTLIFDNCLLKLAYAVSGSSILLGQDNIYYTGPHVKLRNVTIELTHASQCVMFERGEVEWYGGTFQGTVPTRPFAFAGTAQVGLAHVAGLDLSSCATSVVDMNNAVIGEIVISRCKLNGSVSAFTGSVGAGTRMYASVEICDSGSQNYHLRSRQYTGQLYSEATLVREDGASDGTTPISWKMVTESWVTRLTALQTPWIAVWNESTGSAKTVAIEILHDNVTGLSDAEVWIEVFALTTSGFPQASFTKDMVVYPLAGTAQASSSVTWTTTGMSDPNKQKVSVSVTPQMKGLIYARVCLAKPTYTIYVDPFITVS